ncbi:MAG TPA: AraC family transcriptional regulator [Puia sp.]|jgi:AraC-like DNA-binding protein
MKNNSDDKTLTRFSMEDLLSIPRGEVKEYATPMPDRTGSLKLVITDTMGVVDGSMITEKPTPPLEHYNDVPLVEMNFMLEGDICQTQEGLLKQHHYKKGYHNILFNPYAMERNQLMHTGCHRIFSVHLRPEYMMGLFSGYLPEFAPLADKIANGQPFVLHGPDNSLSNQLRYFFDGFWQVPSSPGLRKLYFDSKVLDLLCRQCEVLVGHGAKEGQIPRADLEKVYYARDLIVGRLSDPLSFAELSRLCGLNELKLKKWFKEVFGASVFAFLQEERLMAARRLIYEGQKNMSMIAYELGYAHPQHFQRAFKKRFGLTPKSLLK